MFTWSTISDSVSEHLTRMLWFQIPPEPRGSSFCVLYIYLGLESQWLGQHFTCTCIYILVPVFRLLVADMGF